MAVIRYQGPAANGMPELHKLTPALGVLQDRGQRVAIVTDGRMSGASGKVPAAIHVTPEAAARRSAVAGARRRPDHRRRRPRACSTCTSPTPSSAPATGAAPQGDEWAGTGRELFAAFRATVGPADAGASVFPASPLPSRRSPVVQAV